MLPRPLQLRRWVTHSAPDGEDVSVSELRLRQVRVNVITTTTTGFGFIRNNYQTQQRFQNTTLVRLDSVVLEYNGALIVAPVWYPGLPDESREWGQHQSQYCWCPEHQWHQ
jgi:hypothetical protein